MLVFYHIMIRFVLNWNLNWKRPPDEWVSQFSLFVLLLHLK